MMEINVAEIANMLQLRKNNGRSTILYLGARAGLLFRNPVLNEHIEKLGNVPLDGLNDTEKFHICCRLLTNHERFTASNIHDILTVSLKELQYRQEDSFIADIVKEGFFEIIISSNIDNVLEEAFLHKNMREPYDFRTLTPKNRYPEDIVRHKPNRCTLIKVYGEIETLQYTPVGDAFYLEDNQELKTFLEGALARDILVLGFDPMWDQAIERAFPTKGGDLWFVHEEQPVELSLLAQAIKRRRGKYLVGTNGEYRQFISALHDRVASIRQFYRGSADPKRNNLQNNIASFKETAIVSNAPFQEQVKTLPPQNENMANVIKPIKVFISYSEDDEIFKKQLETHLTMLQREGIIRFHHSQQIEPGKEWKREIANHIDSAQIILLLVSSSFLASDQLYENEMMHAMERHALGSVRVIPIILRSVDLGSNPLFKGLQVLPHNGKSIDTWHNGDKIWSSIAQELREVCEQLSKS